MLSRLLVSPGDTMSDAKKRLEGLVRLRNQELLKIVEKVTKRELPTTLREYVCLNNPSQKERLESVLKKYRDIVDVEFLNSYFFTYQSKKLRRIYEKLRVGGWVRQRLGEFLVEERGAEQIEEHFFAREETMYLRAEAAVVYLLLGPESVQHGRDIFLLELKRAAKENGIKFPLKYDLCVNRDVLITYPLTHHKRKIPQIRRATMTPQGLQEIADIAKEDLLTEGAEEKFATGIAQRRISEQQVMLATCFQEHDQRAHQQLRELLVEFEDVYAFIDIILGLTEGKMPFPRT